MISKRGITALNAAYSLQ